MFPLTLDQVIDEDHPVRFLQEILDALDFSKWKNHYCLVAGRPPIPPKVLAAVVLHGLSLSLRGSRKLEYACKNFNDFIWLAEGRQIDHSTICEFRTRFTAELKDLFAQVGRLAITMGAARLGNIALDGTRIRANSSRHHTASAETLEKRVAALRQEVDKRFAEAEAADKRDRDLFGNESPNVLSAELSTVTKRLERLEKALEVARKKQQAQRNSAAKKSKSKQAEPPAGDVDHAQNPTLPANAAGKPKKKQAEPPTGDIDDARNPTLPANAAGKPKRPKKPRKPKVAVADPDSAVLPNKDGGYAPNYTTVAATEGHGGYILDADVIDPHCEEGVPGEGGQTLAAVDRVAENFGALPQQFLADTAFGSGENLAGLDARGVEAYIPQLQRPGSSDNAAHREDLTDPVSPEALARLPVNARTGKFDRSAFVYDSAADCYYCPMGRVLSYRNTQTKPRSTGPVAYREYHCRECEGCTVRDRCVSGQATHRRVMRDEHEPLREAMDARLSSAAGRAIYRRRSWIAETPFATLKELLGLRQFLHRGLRKVRTEWLWSCTAGNLSKLIRHIASLRARASVMVG